MVSNNNNNNNNKLLLGFEIQTDYLISARRPDLVIDTHTKKEPAELWAFLPADRRVKLKEKRKER